MLLTIKREPNLEEKTGSNGAPRVVASKHDKSSDVTNSKEFKSFASIPIGETISSGLSDDASEVPVNKECTRASERNFDSIDPEFLRDMASGISCPICNREFTYKGGLRKHLQTHNTRRPFACTQCPRKYRSAYDLRKHSSCHDGVSYTCDICKVKCKSKQALKNHRVRKHDNSEYKFTCDKCSRQFKIKSDLTHHIKCYHTNRPPVVCEICGKSFKAAVSLSAHKRTHRINVHQFSCDICKQRFKSEHNLSNHLLLHEKGISCNECGMEFNNTKSLSYHKRVKHTKTDGNICSICHKPFKSQGSLRTHILTHTGERPYKCDQCGEAFTQRSSMMRHRRSHPGKFSPPPDISITSIVKNIEEKVLFKK